MKCNHSYQTPLCFFQENTMAQVVKAVRMILGMDSFASALHGPVNSVERDIKIEDDAPKRKPSLEEMDALEVSTTILLIHYSYMC